jgi:tRNA pseudouridine32 synthase/23S rRNA pseudouridine746 synthase
LCCEAAAEVQQYIAEHEEIRNDADRGKMFGVLVVSLPPSVSGKEGELAFLAAYSGLLAGRNDWSYFVPPVYDAQQPDGHFKTTEREISAKGGDKEMSQKLQLWLFHQYQLLNAHGEKKDLVAIWQSYYTREKLRRKFPLPPGGTGDCCAPKLLQYAYQKGLHPVCMAEFWWGAPTKEEVRQHLNYYPACRGKCKPILTWMLQGLDVDPNPELLGFQHMEIPVVYEDDALLVVNKPSGMLSVPGRIEDYSVEAVMRERYPDSIVVHRLDMGTSGLLIVAKNGESYRILQQQFIRHEVKKKYVALLEHSGEGSGSICLPMRPDPMNRPRQVVDMNHGKRAATRYEFIGNRLVALWPETGRTHQLRIHCAHPDGLANPIVGDELYGTRGQRLCLHAAEIWFRHPVSGSEMHITSEIPF